ncbi:Ku protein [Streptomyces sp. NPDC094049]|uniref:non-homologous end joining protein Ku n=1 Tax=Streptomyces sp. NPDC094049 TaxID=3154987 RepID=UPI00332C1EDC
MARPLWSGAITFGLVTVPVKLEAAVQRHDIPLRQVHLADGGRIRYRKVCEADGQAVAEDDIIKGYEVGKDQIIPVTDSDLAQMPLPTARAIEIIAFTSQDDIDPVQYGAGSYYLTAATPVAAKPYVLLRKALQRTQQAAVAKFALRGRERLGTLRPHGDALLLCGLHWADEIRSPAGLAPPATELTAQEIDGALALVDTMATGALDDVDVTDHYTEALLEVIGARAGERVPRPSTDVPPAAPVVDLMAALEKSVAEARHRRGEGDGTVHEMPAPKEKAAKGSPARSTSPARRRESA